MAEINGAECHRAVGIVRAVGNYHIIFGHNEVEVVLLQIAAGQTLGGFGGKRNVSARRCRVGVYKLCTGNGYVVQLIFGVACHKLTFAVIVDVESDLVFTGIVLDAAEAGILLTDDIGLLAYGFREIQVKLNAAVCFVRGGDGGVRSRTVCRLFAQCEQEFALVQCAVADIDIQFLGGVQSYCNVLRRIGVDKFCDVSGFGSIRETVLAVALIILDSVESQLAVAFVLDSYLNLIAGLVVFDARNIAAVLRDDVSISAFGAEYQLLITADDGSFALPVGGRFALLVDGSSVSGRHGGIALTCCQGEAEGIVVPCAAIQLFFDLEQVFGGKRARFCVVGVYKLGSAVFGVLIAVFNLGVQLVVVTQRNLDGGGDIIGGLGHAGNSSVIFRNGVGVNTRLFVGDYIEIGDLFDIASRYFDCCVSGHRGITVVRLKGKGERVTLFPVTADNALAYAQLGFGFACKGVGEGHLVGVYFCPRAVFVLIVGGRDAQGFRFRTIARNFSLNQVLLLAVINIILLIRRIFGKLVIIGVTTVAVVQRVGDICKGNCAILIVGGACHAVCSTVRHGDDGVVKLLFVFVFRCRFEFEVELTVGQGHRFCFVVLIVVPVDFRGLNIERLGLICKGVGKLNSRSIGGCITIFLNNRGFHFQLAVDVRDGNRHTVEGAVIRNTFNFIFGGDILGDVVHIRAGFGEFYTSEVKGNRHSFGGAFSTIQYVRCIAFAIICRHHPFGQRCVSRADSLQFEVEMIAVPPITARQNLYALERVIDVIRGYLNLSRLIGVCHRDFLGCTCRDLALAVRNVIGVVGGQILFRDGIVAACGQAHNLGSLAVFQFEGIAAFNGVSTINAVNGVVILGIVSQVLALFGCQRKLHRKVGVEVRVQTLVGFNLLGNLQAALGVHGQLTVVAKVQHTLVCGKVPLEVNAAIGGAGLVCVLIAQLAINSGGQAAFFDALLDVAFAIFCNNTITDFFIGCNANGHIVGLFNRLSMLRGNKMQVVQLIVIDFALLKVGNRLICNGSAIINFVVQQGILGMVVEAVACCGGKGGSGQADGFAVCRFFVFIKFVGVEADFAVFGVFLNVGGKVGVGKAAGRNLVVHTIFKADRVDDTDGLGVVDFQLGGAIGVCDLIIPQGQHTGRDHDPHMVAFCAAAMGDGDFDIRQIGGIGVGVVDRVVMRTRKGIGIHIAGGVCCHRLFLKDLCGKGNGLKALDFHVIAQGIFESHIAAILGLVRNMRGACRFGRYRREDVLKDLVQPSRIGSRQIVIGIGRFGAEVPVIGTEQPITFIRVSGKGVVAGDRLHELVFS